MQPKTLGLVAASVITGVFVAAVGLVFLWPFLSNPHEHLGFPQGGAPVEKPLAAAELPKVRGAVVPAKDYTLSEPHVHGNLTIFLIHGKDTVKDAKIITLQEALDTNVAVVRDTGHSLTIDNRSNMTLFIQAGDIVKGGNQDRTLPYDMLVPANTQNVPVAALCVEKDRSFPRGNEVSASFATATAQLPTRELKLAALRQSQQDVWKKVSELQTDLARNSGGSVQAALSQTSLQLSLEHHNVQGAVEEYLDKLAPAVEGQKDVIGYAVVVNGQIQYADVYASNAMFLKLWPKLIRASAVEALSERDAVPVFEGVNVEAVKTFLTGAEKGNLSRVDANRSTVIRHENERTLMHDTCDTTRKNVVLHRSVLAK